MDFFISYTQADQDWAEWIAWELERAGFQCIIQAWDFAPGSDFIASMRRAMSEAQQTIVVLSKGYLESRYAAAELNPALALDPIGEKRALVPVRIADCDPPDMLRSRVYIDLAGLDEDIARQRLIEGVQASRAARRKPSGGVRFPRPPGFPVGSQEARQNAGGAVAGHKGPPAGGGPLRLLFLASDCGLGLNLEGELAAIEGRLKESGSPYELASRFDAKPEDFLPMLEEHRPNVFHFSGNFTGSAIALTSKDEGVRTIPFTALVGLFRTAAPDTRLAVLNACDSLECAEQLADLFGCAIGVKNQIEDAAAIAFAKHFYGGLAKGKSVRDAFDSAVASMRFEELENQDLPQLVVRPWADAAALRFL
jgi:hypothetical protein